MSNFLKYNASSEEISDYLDELFQEKQPWAETIVELYKLIDGHQKEQGRSDKEARHEALSITYLILRTMGGKQFYLPSVKRLELLARNAQIWQDWTGRNMLELVKKYELTEVMIYKIIEEQRSINTKRNQQSLF